MLTQEGTIRTKNSLPHLYTLQPEVVNGKRLKFISGLKMEPVDGAEEEMGQGSSEDERENPPRRSVETINSTPRPTPRPTGRPVNGPARFRGTTIFADFLRLRAEI